MIYVIHSIFEAPDAGQELDKILLKRELRNPEIKKIIDIAKDRLIPVQFVPEEKLNRLSRKNHQGIIAFISSIEYSNIENLIPMIYEDGRDPFLVILDGLTDVRNFGAIARTAECAGVDAIIIPDKGSVSVTGDAVKTSAGALMRIPVCRVSSISETIKFLQDNGIRVMVASEKATKEYTNIEMNSPLAIVMGAEDKGASLDTIRKSDELIAIPQVGSIGSLNVSVAAAIIMYEVFRQRKI